jgi:hypothetical protein
MDDFLFAKPLTSSNHDNDANHASRRQGGVSLGHSQMRDLVYTIPRVLSIARRVDHRGWSFHADLSGVEFGHLRIVKEPLHQRLVANWPAGHLPGADHLVFLLRPLEVLHREAMFGEKRLQFG